MKKDDIIARTVVSASDEGETYTLEAKVTWVVGDEAGITFLSPPDWKDGAKVINLIEEPDWKVIVESVPSFQSSVVEMTEEQLRESIDGLRESRKHIPAPRTRGSRVSKDDPIAKALANMGKEEREALMKKLGIE